MRAGAYALSLLSTPLNAHVLQALDEGAKPLVDLRRAAGSPPPTTMRGHLRVLTESGILERRRQEVFPGAVDYELGAPGRELIGVAQILRRWLGMSPEGELELGSPAAKSVIKALVEGWSSGIVRALAARPFSLTELSGIITGLTYPSLERRLGAMRLAGQIEPCPGGGRGTPYKVTDWLRHAIGPIAAAARWERHHLTEATTPIAKIDVEAAFLLVVPLLELSDSQSGTCRLAVESRTNSGESRLAGVMIGVEDGRVASCIARLEGEAGAWVFGSATAWLRALNEHEPDQLELGGDSALAEAVLEGLHTALFGVRRASP